MTTVPLEGWPAWAGPCCLAMGMAGWLGAAAAFQPTAVAMPSPVSSARVVAPPVVAPVDPPTVQPTIETRVDTPCSPALEIAFPAGDARPSDDVAIEPFLQWLATRPGARVVVEGYASTEGSPADNLRLSHARARAVRKRLLHLGARRDRIAIQAFGEYRPSLAHDDRRVVVRVAGMPVCGEEES